MFKLNLIFSILLSGCSFSQQTEFSLLQRKQKEEEPKIQVNAIGRDWIERTKGLEK